MSSATDVAIYILNKEGPMSAMKLQKLVFYSQAWSLVWDEKPLFSDRIEAWANGPVCPALYQEHRGKFIVSESDIAGNKDNLNESQQETIDAVITAYGEKSSHWLSSLTHQEDPWKNARGKAPPGTRCTNEISLASMEEYYGSLV